MALQCPGVPPRLQVPARSWCVLQSRHVTGRHSRGGCIIYAARVDTPAPLHARVRRWLLPGAAGTALAALLVLAACAAAPSAGRPGDAASAPAAAVAAGAPAAPPARERLRIVYPVISITSLHVALAR